MRAWLDKLRSLLGYFWTWLFKDSDFILGVENLHAMLYTALANKVTKRALMQSVSTDKKLATNPPFPVLIDVDTIEAISEEILPGDTVESLWEKLNAASSTRWQARLAGRRSPSCFMLCDHACDNNIMLIDKIDYSITDNVIILYVDPKTLGLCEYKTTTDDGVLHTYYVMWGFSRPETVISDFVMGALNIRDNIDSKIVWNAHTNGITALTFKQLLAPRVGAVVAPHTDTITYKATEQGISYIVTSDETVISAPASCTYCGKTVNSSIKAGDTIFGTLTVYANGEMPLSSEILYMPVSTPVGTLVAVNADKPVVTESGIDILPLYTLDSVMAGDLKLSTEYKNYVKSNYNKETAIPIDKTASGSINVVKFLHSKLRKGHSVLLSLAPSDVTNISAIDDLIDKEIDNGTILTVGWKTGGEITADDIPILDNILSSANVTVSN